MMKKHLICLLSLIFSLSRLPAQSVDLSYYLPQSDRYDKTIPAPEAILGYQAGDWHAGHDRIIEYIRAVDAASDRVRLVRYGYSFEHRPLYLLIVTSPANQQNLDQIKAEHLKLSDPAVSPSVETGHLPVFTWLGHSIHGNEASGANAALLLLYHLAAAGDDETLRQLEESVIFIDPLINPDGYSRFSQWVNSHKSIVPNDDTQEREHAEAWPGGRGNHYWFDLNRDWLNQQQPESQSRIATLIEWRPNVYTDAHEQGSAANYHFSPGEPSRVHPLIPDRAQDFIKRLAKDYYAPAFDEQGLLYFSSENFDDYYPGRGREYLDFHGGIALLWEQPSPRGFVQSTPNGILTFPLAIRNQLTAGLATIRGSHAMRKELLDYQKWYFRQALEDAAHDRTKAYVFGSRNDAASAYHLAELVKRNGIDIYRLADDIEAGGKRFDAATSFIVPLDQPQNRIIHAIFEIRETYADSISYDITGWTLPFAFNLDYAPLTTSASSLKGDKFDLSRFPQGKFTGDPNAYAYAFEWSGYYAPRALYRLLRAGISVKVSDDKFTAGGRTFDKGTVLIPLGDLYQAVTPAEIYAVAAKITEEDAIDVYAVAGGLTGGHNLGSSAFRALTKPRIAVLATGSAGEVWHLFDQRFGIPVSVLASDDGLARVDLNKYNVLIVPGGSIPVEAQAAIREWVSAGNTLIGFESALASFSRAQLLNVEFVSANRHYTGPYRDFGVASRAQGIAGVIFNTRIDLTHPLAWGYGNENLPVFKNSNLIVKPAAPHANTPVAYTEKPLLSGNVLPRVVDVLAGTPVAVLGRFGSGRVIGFAVNPNFRAIWYGTNRLMTNAVFFGQLINPATLASPPSDGANTAPASRRERNE
jgi:hypothetical protein